MYHAIQKILHRLIQKLYTHEDIVLFAHKHDVQQQSPAIVLPATRENIPDILSFQHPRYVQTFLQFLNNGDSGYLAYLNKRCVHRSWVQHGPQVVYPHWAAPYTITHNDIFIHYSETAPEARGKNIFPHVLSHIAKNYQNKNILISVNKKNIPSIKGIEKSGFVLKETIHVRIFLGISFNKHSHASHETTI